MECGRCKQKDCACQKFDSDTGKLCDCGHNRCMHLPPPASHYGSAHKLGKSISEMVAPSFEREVNGHLADHLPDCLSGCRISDIRNRSVVDETAGDALTEIDSFGCCYEDSLDFGREMPACGMFLLNPGVSQECVQAATLKLSKSPGALGRKIEDKIEKCIVGETYSGQNEMTVGGKVASLEERIQKMIVRYTQNHGIGCADVTSAVGAALLCFSCGSKSRKDSKAYFSTVILDKMDEIDTPLLWRIAKAHRLFLVVLSNSECPISATHRQLAQQTESLELSLNAVEVLVNAIHTKLDLVLESIDKLGGFQG